MHALQQQVDLIRRGLIWQRRLRAICWVLTAAVGCALVLGASDYWYHFKDIGLRILATFVLLLVVAWVAFRTWYLPARTAMRPLDVARRIEGHFPQLQDSLASAIEFLDQSEDESFGGSTQLRRLVVANTLQEINGLPLSEVIDPRPLRRAVVAFSAVAFLTAVCIVVDSSAARIALARLISPFGSAQWPRQHHLAFREIPLRVAAGQTLELELTDTSGPPPDDVRIQFAVDRDKKHEVTSEPMTRTGDILIARRENIQQRFGFRAEGGDDDTMPWHWVEVVEIPKLESLKITIYPPSYTGLPATTAGGNLEVLSGSQIEVSGLTDKPIQSAKISQIGRPSIDAVLDTTEPGRGRSFHVPPERWVATQAGKYRLDVTDSEGTAGSVGEWNLRVKADPPPSVSWQDPGDDLYVLPRAVVPMNISVKDNLAVKQVDLHYERQGVSDPNVAAVQSQISLYRGPDKAISPTGDAASAGESRTIEYAWDLAPLQLSVGAQITVTVEAQDYRPGTGRTPSPRRISIVDVEKINARLADRQLQIVRQLERALAIEQKTRDDVRQLEIEQRDAGSLSAASQRSIQSTETNQRGVRRIIADPAEGVPFLIDALLREITINRLETPTLREAMERLAAEVRRLASEPLSVADRELTATRKSTADMHANDALSKSLATAASAQDDVVKTLERLITELSGKSDVRKIAQQLVELHKDQLAHENLSREQIGIKTLPLTVSELSRPQRAVLNKAAAGQESLASRFEKIEQALDQLTQQLGDNGDEAVTPANESLRLARELNIEFQMRQAATELRENRIGRALDREREIAEKVQRMLDALRNEEERKSQNLAEKLRNAEQRLDQLRQQTAELRQQIVNVESTPTAPNQSADALAKRQQETKGRIDQLAKELNRLQASDAAKSTQSAAGNLGRPNANSNGKPNGANTPTSSKQVQKAEQDLKMAAAQLAERRQQAEDDLALEIVRRFQAELTEMVKRQRQVVDDTTALEPLLADKTSTAERDKRVTAIAEEERQLAELAKEHGEMLTGLEAVRVSLEDTERRLRAAGSMLETHQSGQLVLNAERLALARLEGMLHAFAQTAAEATPQQNAPPPAGTGAPNNSNAPQRRPTFELLQAKMLRAMQLDLNERTAQHQQRISAAAIADTANLQEEAQQLAAEQARLAELVESMIKRDNEARQQPPGH
jgi:hypothetical protein